MKSSFVRAVVVAALVAAAAAGSRPAASQEPEPAYAVRYLPSLGGVNSRGNSIIDSGWIAGYSNLTTTVRHAALWRGDAVTDLGTLGSPERNSNVAWPVKNERGILAGISQTDEPDLLEENWSCSAFFPPATATGFTCLGFVWQNGVMRELPTLGGTHGFATGVNNLGQIVGWAENTKRDRTCTPPQKLQFQAVTWDADTLEIRELPRFRGNRSSAATAVNDNGQVVGIAGTCDQAIGRATAEHMVLWQGGKATEIPNLGGRLWNTPMAINERGDVVGFSNLPGDVITHAFLWTPEGATIDLGTLVEHGHEYSEAHGINEQRQVVGVSCTADFSECRAFLWEQGRMRDLNDHVTLGENELLTHGQDINNLGVIVGRAFNTVSQERPAFEATPLAGAATIGARALDGHVASRHIALQPEAVRELLSPLGPGRARLDDITAVR